MNARGAPLRFALTGVLNTIVGLGTIALAREVAGVNEYAANAMGYAVGIAVGFMVNRRWTFASGDGPLARQLAGYVLAFVVSFAANLAVLHLGLTLGWPGLLAQAAALSTYSIVFYLSCRWFAFSTG